MVVQINGKLRGKILAPENLDEVKALDLIKKDKELFKNKWKTNSKNYYCEK